MDDQPDRVPGPCEQYLCSPSKQKTLYNILERYQKINTNANCIDTVSDAFHSGHIPRSRTLCGICPQPPLVKYVRDCINGRLHLSMVILLLWVGSTWSWGVVHCGPVFVSCSASSHSILSPWSACGSGVLGAIV